MTHRFMRGRYTAFIVVIAAAVGVAPTAVAQTELAAGPPTGVAATGTDLEAALGAEADADLPDWILSSGSWLANGIPDPDAKRPAPRAPAEAKKAPKKKTPSPVQVAIKTAKEQIGKPYRWGSVGPNSFDCSGLVNFAYGRAGVGLPRTSRGLYAALPRVKRAELRPGDLIFSGWGRVTHVGIYIGKGLIVHSPQTGERVKISPMRRNYIGAGRPVR